MAVTATRNRIQVTVGTTVRMALEILADRNGLTVSTQAAMLLRQACDRTIGSEEFAKRHKAYVLSRGNASWRQDQVEEHAIESTYASHRDEIARQT